MDITHGIDWKYLDKRASACQKALRANSVLFSNFKDGYDKLCKHLTNLDREGKRSIIAFVCASRGLEEYDLTNDSYTNMLSVTTTPYIRPLLAKLEEWDEYCMVLIDQTHARIVMVSHDDSTVRDIAKEIFHHHKKGGMSQARYQRLHDGNVHFFFNEVQEELRRALAEHPKSRLITAGPVVARRHFEAQLTRELRDRIIGSLDIGTNIQKGTLISAGRVVAGSEMHRVKHDIMESIYAEILKDGLATYGEREIYEAVISGRAEVVVVSTTIEIPGWRCSRCRLVSPGTQSRCTSCGSMVAPLDFVQKTLLEAQRMGTKFLFIESDPHLEELGGMAALLRF